MAIICPTVLAGSEEMFASELARAESLARRIQIDLVDGIFVEPATIDLGKIFWSDGIKSDLHLMYTNPAERLDMLVDLRPNLVIMHKEANSELLPIFDELKSAGIKAGVALLQATSVSSASAEIMAADHVMIFGGNLGSYGGQANLELLSKIDEIKAINNEVEIGWDGGVNPENIAQIAMAGVDVINVGGYLQKAAIPQEAYAILEAKLKTVL